MVAVVLSLGLLSKLALLVVSVSIELLFCIWQHGLLGWVERGEDLMVFAECIV